MKCTINRDKSVKFEEAQILYQNFSGREGMYNSEGQRNFNLVLDDDSAEGLHKAGWNVKTRKGSDGEPDTHLLKVSIGYGFRPPNIVMITSKGRVVFTEDMLEVLDWIDIESVDLIVRPHNWNKSGRSGVKAWVKSLYVHVIEDELALKYEDLPEIDIHGREIRAITTGGETLALPPGTDLNIIEGEVVGEYTEDEEYADQV